VTTLISWSVPLNVFLNRKEVLNIVQKWLKQNVKEHVIGKYIFVVLTFPQFSKINF